MNVLIFAAALKVLTIGNSFSVQMVNAMPPIAKDMGLELDICSLYIGGCSFERHWKNVCNPTNKPYSVTRNTFGTPIKGFSGNIPEMLKADKWDVVTIQQASHFSWKPESYHPYADNLVKTIRELAPQAKIVVHETWSYTPWDGRLKKWGIDQNEMYEKLHAAYGDFAKQYGFEVIPTGTAVQLWRKELPVRYTENSFGGDACGSAKFVKDEKTGKYVPKGDVFHMNGYGNHLQALVWTAKLFGADVTKCTFNPKEMPVNQVVLMRKVAMEAVHGAAEPYKDGDVVVFFGDSITHGGRYHEYITDFYRTRFPEANIRFVNAGVGGDAAAAALPRIPDDIVPFAPTHVTFHFGMNDINRGLYLQKTTAETLAARERAQSAYRQALPKLVAAVRRVAPQAKFTYLTPTTYDDTAVVTNAPKTGWASVNQVGCNLGLSLMAGFVIERAKSDKVPYVDWFSTLNDFTLRHQKENPHFSVVVSDRVHPAELGHSIMAWEFLKRQGVPSVVSDVAVDAVAAKATKSENAAVTDVKGDASGVRFTVLAKALPFPVHAKALPYVGEFDVEKTLNRETLAVACLKSGTYALKIDGTEVGRYTAQELARGVGLGFNAKTPQYRQAQEVFARQETVSTKERGYRNCHYPRWAFQPYRNVDDLQGMLKWYESDPKNRDNYFARFIPDYVAYWPKHVELRAELWKEQQTVRALAKPVPHVYEIVGVR